MDVRTASSGEFERVAAFYRTTGYRPAVSPDDVLVLAEDGAGICGVLRLCVEGGTTVLRGMRVAPALQRRGIGTQLLRRAEEILGPRECYCIPHRRLCAFYERAGFEEIALGDAPGFLQDRWKQYTDELALDVIVMRRHFAQGGA